MRCIFSGIFKKYAYFNGLPHLGRRRDIEWLAGDLPAGRTRACRIERTVPRDAAPAVSWSRGGDLALGGRMSARPRLPRPRPPRPSRFSFLRPPLPPFPAACWPESPGALCTPGLFCRARFCSGRHFSRAPPAIRTGAAWSTVPWSRRLTPVLGLRFSVLALSPYPANVPGTRRIPPERKASVPVGYGLTPSSQAAPYRRIPAPSDTPGPAPLPARWCRREGPFSRKTPPPRSRSSASDR